MDHRICRPGKQNIQLRLMKGIESSLTLLDGIILALVLAVAITSAFLIYGNKGDTLHLIIEASSGSWTYDLDTQRTVSIPGPLGNTIVQIGHGQARITDSPCPNKTCVAAGPISKKGEWSACLPNQVMIRVEGTKRNKKTNDPDVIGY